MKLDWRDRAYLRPHCGWVELKGHRYIAASIYEDEKTISVWPDATNSEPRIHFDWPDGADVEGAKEFADAQYQLLR